MARPSIRRSGNAWHSDDPLGSNHGSHSTCKLNSIQQPWVWTYLACPHLWPFWTGKYGNDVLIQWNWRQLLYSIPHQNVRCKDVRAVFFFQQVETSESWEPPSTWWFSNLTMDFWNFPRVQQALVSLRDEAFKIWDAPKRDKHPLSLLEDKELCCLRRHINWTAQTHHLSSSPESYPWTLG